jgi:hypothetical protein
MRRLLTPTTPRARKLLTLAGVLASSVCLAVGLVAGAGSGALLGVAAGDVFSSMCWVLVAAGITGNALASSGRGHGWLLLFGLQPLWIAYALYTGQIGLVIGCVAHSAAQVNGFLRSGASTAREACDTGEGRLELGEGRRRTFRGDRPAPLRGRARAAPVPCAEPRLALVSPQELLALRPSLSLCAQETRVRSTL